MSLTLEEKFEKIKDLRPIDDVFFEVLASNKLVCEEILRTILQDPELIVKDVIVQSSERNLYGRSVRLDALCFLKNGLLVNIEVQRSDNDDYLNRALFNGSNIIVKESQTGTDFFHIPRVCVIFISEFDPFKEGKTCYHIDKVIRESGTVIEDALMEIFINTKNDDETDIAELMKCFMQKKVNNPKFPILSKEVKRIKTTKGGATAMCKIMEYYENIARKEGKAEGKAEGRAEGRAEGIVEGKEQGKISTLISLVGNGLLTMSQAIKESGLTEDEFKKKMAETINI